MAKQITEATREEQETCKGDGIGIDDPWQLRDLELEIDSDRQECY